MIPTTRVQRASDTAWRRVQDEVAIISMDVNRIRLLNRVGSFLWERCDNTTVAELVDALCVHFDVDAETARRDVDTFIDDLRTRGLLTTGGAL